MGEIINSITLAEYSQLSHEEKDFYNELMKSVKAVEVMRGLVDHEPKYTDFWDLSWEQIEILRESISAANLEGVINAIYDIDNLELKSISITNIVGCYKWIENKFLEIVEAEKSQAGDFKPTQQQINAGINNFQQFGFYNSLDELTGGDVLKEDEIMKLPYWKIFRKLCRNRVKADYNEAITKQK